MPAGDHLNETLFHGSVANLDVGDVIQPSTTVGYSRFQAMYEDHDQYHQGHSRGDHVYMAHNENDAWTWANRRVEGDDNPQPWMERSPKVFEVAPESHHDPEEIGVPGGELIHGERVTPKGQGARITAVHYARVGEQAEIPGHNWGAHSIYDGFGNSPQREATVRDAAARTGTYISEHIQDTRKRGVYVTSYQNAPRSYTGREWTDSEFQRPGWASKQAPLPFDSNV